MKRAGKGVYEGRVPQWFSFYSKVWSGGEMQVQESTAVSPLSLLLLAPSLQFRRHPDPSGDPSLDQGTKKRLGVLFPRPDTTILTVTLAGARLLVCRQETAERVQLVRSVLDSVLQAESPPAGKQ